MVPPAAQREDGGGVQLRERRVVQRVGHTAPLVFPTAEGYPRPIVCMGETRGFAGPPTSEKRHKRSEIQRLLSTIVDIFGEAVAEVCVTRSFAFVFNIFNSYINGGLSMRWRAARWT